MKIRFIGTGYGECMIKKRLSKEYRRRAALLIDERLLIDATMSIFDFADEFGFDGLFTSVSDVLYTSSEYISEQALTRLSRFKKINVYANPSLAPLIPKTKNIEFIPTPVLTLTNAGGYKVLTLPTTHRSEIRQEICVSYAISKDKSVLYQPNGALVTPEASMVLEGIHLDGAVIGCADGINPPNISMQENNFDMSLILKDMLVARGIMNTGAKITLTNIPTNKKKTIHEDLCELAAPKGVNIAYDGYFINI